MKISSARNGSGVFIRKQYGKKYHQPFSRVRPLRNATRPDDHRHVNAKPYK